jgi:hypothetical protein
MLILCLLTAMIKKNYLIMYRKSAVVIKQLNISVLYP